MFNTVDVIRDVEYGPLPDHRLDVYRPKDGAAICPTLLYIHGGGFRILSKDTHWMMAALFAQAGYTVFNVNYRLAPRYPYPAACEDVAQAALWLKKHALEYGGDSEAWAVAGESAGANLSLALTIANCSPRSEPFANAVFEAELPIRCVLPACGILQVSDSQRFRRERPDLPVFFSDRIDVVCSGYLSPGETNPGLADPLLLLENPQDWTRPLPPMMAIVGDGDPILEDSLRLGRALDELQVVNEIPVFNGGGHAFHALFWRPLSEDAWRQQIEFLGLHLSHT